MLTVLLKTKQISTSYLSNYKNLIAFCLLLFFFNTPNAKAVVAVKSSSNAAVQGTHLTKKEKRKIRRWKKFKAKLLKSKDGKKRKSRFGRLGLIILLGGLLSLFLIDGLFLLSLIASVVLGIIGLIKDEKKLAAVLALALPLVTLATILILVGRSLGG